MRVNNSERVEELFHAALQLGAEDRAAYLARECAGDETLRAEVESLVAASESGYSFIEQSVLSLGMKVLSDGLAGSLVGRAVGHYQVVKLLGRGGMGEVYLAEDSVLERPVALKFIASHFTGDEWAREQLTNEARAVARLENANICAVFGVEKTESHHFIVMQYCEGETLAALLRREEGGVGSERALALAEQLAAALAAAHARGIVHRDVKPQNIIVAEDGQIKVLDFGLAKFVRPPQGARDADDADGQPTQLGGVIGTVAYMSPEQARGEELDCRSDIFSFGIVLYEMLGGQNPFLRETDKQTIAAIESEDAPSLAALPSGTRAGLERVARKCLAKERELRYETGAELLRDLHDIRSAGEREAATAVTARERAARRRVHLKRYAAAALVLVLLLLTGTGFAYWKLTTVHTLAVLPITNQSGDPGTNYLSEGFTRSLFDKFSYLPRLRLRLPSVVPPDRDERAELAKIGRELKAEAVLSGRVFKEGQSLLLQLSLLRAEDATLVWEKTFNLGAADTLALQDEISREVTSRLGMWLPGSALYRRQTDSEEALQLYMRGRAEWAQRKNKDDVQRAIDYFELAVVKDPTYAKAYAGLADCYTLRNNVAYGTAGVREAMDKAGYNARKAVEAGDSLPEAHTSLGLVKLRYEWDWAGAERELKRAIELNPDYAPAHYWYSNLLAAMRRFDESIKEAETAKSLDPYSPLSHMNYGRALYYARRYEEAVSYLSEAAGRYPDHPQLPHVLAIALTQQGRYDEAIPMLEAMRPKHSRHVNSALGFAYGRAGRLDEAAEILRDLDRLSTPEEPMPPQEKAFVYIGMGKRDEAFAKLEEVYKGRFSGLAYLLTEPSYDSLRDDLRFADLVRRANLTP